MVRGRIAGEHRQTNSRRDDEMPLYEYTCSKCHAKFDQLVTHHADYLHAEFRTGAQMLVERCSLDEADLGSLKCLG